MALRREKRVMLVMEKATVEGNLFLDWRVFHEGTALESEFCYLPPSYGTDDTGRPLGVIVVKWRDGAFVILATPKVSDCHHFMIWSNRNSPLDAGVGFLVGRVAEEFVKDLSKEVSGNDAVSEVWNGPQITLTNRQRDAVRARSLARRTRGLSLAPEEMNTKGIAEPDFQDHMKAQESDNFTIGQRTRSLEGRTDNESIVYSADDYDTDSDDQPIRRHKRQRVSSRSHQSSKEAGRKRSDSLTMQGHGRIDNTTMHEPQNPSTVQVVAASIDLSAVRGAVIIHFLRADESVLDADDVPLEECSSVEKLFDTYLPYEYAQAGPRQAINLLAQINDDIHNPITIPYGSTFRFGQFIKKIDGALEACAAGASGKVTIKMSQAKNV